MIRYQKVTGKLTREQNSRNLLTALKLDQKKRKGKPSVLEKFQPT